MLDFPVTALATHWQGHLDEAGRVETEILR